uniref:Mannose-6-phosphate isomerase n=1 Tax=Parascaris univalens TaxID=6257 RepID=A0A915ALC1_PARUN
MKGARSSSDGGGDRGVEMCVDRGRRVVYREKRATMEAAVGGYGGLLSLLHRLGGSWADSRCLHPRPPHSHTAKFTLYSVLDSRVLKFLSFYQKNHLSSLSTE